MAQVPKIKGGGNVGVPTNPPGVTRQLVLNLMKQGMSQRDIARTLKMSSSNIVWHVRLLRGAGELPLAASISHNGEQGDTRIKVMELTAQGLSVQEIADIVGIKKSVVAYHQKMNKKEQEELLEQVDGTLSS